METVNIHPAEEREKTTVLLLSKWTRSDLGQFVVSVSVEKCFISNQLDRNMPNMAQ